MADVIKVLGQKDSLLTTKQTLYTVPNLAQTTTSSLVICNRTGSGETYRINIRVAGAATDDKQFLYYGKSLAANETFTAVLGLTLGQGDIVEIWASAVDLSFSLFGVETS